ncbi:hypothetical protein NL676_009038 [Syzygium grande]|nr:hypothetical protein NL676_009038 [Syzygium grande]
MAICGDGMVECVVSDAKLDVPRRRMWNYLVEPNQRKRRGKFTMDFVVPMTWIGNAAKMNVELAKGLLDIVRQTLGNENSFLVKYFRRNSYIVGRPQGPCARASVRLDRLNEYLLEYKDPTHV